MLRFGRAQKSAVLEAVMAAIEKSQAVIEFTPDGKILTANENFLATLGYGLDEVRGRQHSMFVDAATRESPEYRAFWSALARGEHQAGEFRRIAKGGREVWLQAVYTPILDSAGKPMKVVKFGSDVTARKLAAAESASQLAAIGRSQAVIEFALDGKILGANENFLKTVGYRLDEIQGRHHSIFIEASQRESPDYKAFWSRLAEGEYQSGEFKRIGKNGREIWLQASYNPVLDPSGKPWKVVKFASDITGEKRQAAEDAGQLTAINKSQAVIEFTLDGKVLTANENFLKTMGYRLDEIQGKPHANFVAAEERDGADYRAFWEGLRAGRFQAGEYRRVAKGGRTVWLQASYNPIIDASGRPVKVVKFASDVTSQVVARMRSERVAQMMETVAASAEELNVSVREIAGAMSKSRVTAEGAFDLVTSADQSTGQLADAAKAMGGIIVAIDAITAKINLLALNASIESARAGDAGKGFAVVANEVKSLATQAKEATEQIAREIESMRGISGQVVSGLGSIRQSIEQVREYVTATAAAVEEQSAVASDMSVSMQRASEEAAAVG